MRGRVAALLALTFAAGMAAGVAVDRLIAEGPDVPAKQASEDRRRGSGGGTATIERFADELGLTAEQRREIAPIVERARADIHGLFEPVRPAYREIVDSARVRIEAVLTPEQTAEYRRLLERDYGSAEGRERRDGPHRRHDGRENENAENR